jgi:polyisoprenoid-binding protein YceI
MRPFLFSLCLFLGLAGPLFGPAHAVDSEPESAPAGVYLLDPKHVSIIWSVRHLGLSDFVGRFDTADGRLVWNGATPETSSLSVTIDPASISTRLPDFDQTLAGPDWFDAERHPAITFRSTQITRTGPTSGTITGDLTLHGVTRPMTLDAVFNGSTFNLIERRRALGFSAVGMVNRSEFGLDRFSAFVGDAVMVRIEAEFLRE